MNITDHLLTAARHWQTPNFDDRPSASLDLIVVHSISLPPGKFGTDLPRRLFCRELDAAAEGLPDLEGVHVSSHLLIDRHGQVDQFVPFSHRAWHAGISSWRGRSACNDFSVGIELEGADTRPFEAVQYGVLADICASLISCYGAMDIAGHCHIAPERKTDPGPAFNWLRLQRELARRL